MERLLTLVDSGAVDTVIIAKLDRLTRSVADLAELLKRFERRRVSLVSVADSLDTRSAAGQNSMAMNWPQLVKPRACRSALCSLTAFSNSPRENSFNTCEKMLHTFYIG